MPRKTAAPVNPFQYGRELSARELVDRDEELHLVLRTIENRGKLFLIGPRRFGKTSLLQAATERAEGAGAVVLRFDAEKFETLTLLAEAILTAATQALKGPIERAAAAVSKAAAKLRPSITLGPDGNISVSLSVDPGSDLPALSNALDAVETLAKKLDQPVAVILDEIQQVVVEHGEAAEKQLRATIQRHRATSYIFAGSAVRLLTAMTGNADRPFYRLGARQFLDVIPRSPFLDFLRDGFARVLDNPPEEMLVAILDIAADVPYNVQRLAHEVWERFRTEPELPATRAMVEATARRIVRMEDPAYAQVWTQLSKNQKRALKAVIANRGERLQAAEVTGKAGLSPSSMQTALQSLETNHIVRSTADQGKLRYTLVDPFFVIWLTAAQAL